MKTIKKLTVTFILLVTIISTTFLGCDPDNNNHPGIEKPNIYIYPTEAMQLSINLSFPQGGEIVKSIPNYASGWNVKVVPSGLIDNKYSFLFYESNQPKIWQTAEGWIIQKDKLKNFFIENMTAYGFEGQEIIDFIEYWIPQLKKFEYYAIYPQTYKIIDQVVRLEFSKKPDHLLRLFYKIEGFNKKNGAEPTQPKINHFERKGFFVTEWGVTLKR